MIKGVMKDNVCLWKNCSRNRKRFKYRNQLVEHLRSHTGENANICPVSPLDVITCLTSDIKGPVAIYASEKTYFFTDYLKR